MKIFKLIVCILLTLPSVATAQDRIILCDEGCKERQAKEAEEERRKLANTQAVFVGQYSFGEEELDNKIFDQNEKYIGKYGFIDLTEVSFKKDRMRLGAKRKAIAACHKVHQVRRAADGVKAYNVNASVDFDNSKTSCTEKSCSVSGDCSFLGLGQYSRPRIWQNTLFGRHVISKNKISTQYHIRNMDDKFDLSSNCNVIDSLYVEGPENWIGSSPTLVQTYYKSAIALCE